MKARITANLGEGRYTVTVQQTNALLRDSIAQAQAAREAAIEALNLAQIEVNETQAVYESAELAVRGEISDYEQETAAITSRADDCRADSESACGSERIACQAECAQEGGGFPCLQRCDTAYAACVREGQERCEAERQRAQTDADRRYLKSIAAAQARAVERRTAYAAAVRALDLAKARKLQAEMALQELSDIGDRQIAVTTVSAQRETNLSAGQEVELAMVPSGQRVVTSLHSTQRSLVDARSLPARYLFVDAALAPGVETWVPSWRVGTVLAIVGDRLQVRLDPAILYGSLGTVDSRAPITCAPPQAYFDGTADESAIVAAAEALAAAQEALHDAYAARVACKRAFDLPACIATGQGACKAQWDLWLAACQQTAEPDCETQYESYLALCNQQAADACLLQQSLAYAACDAQYPIAALQAAVRAAETAYHIAVANHRAPADPLVMTLPVAHCSPAAYQVDDRVLVDFPTRATSAADKMAAWNSARVVGWADNPRVCGASYIAQLDGAQRWAGSCDGVLVETETPVAPQWWQGTQDGVRRVVYWSARSVWYLGVEYEFTGIDGDIYAAAVDADAAVLLVSHSMIVSGTAQLQIVACPVGDASAGSRRVIATGSPSYAFAPFPYPWNVVDRSYFLDKHLAFSESASKLCFSMIPNNAVYTTGTGIQQVLFANGAAWQAPLTIPAPGAEPLQLQWTLVCQDTPSISFVTEFETCRTGANWQEELPPGGGYSTTVKGEDTYSYPVCFGALWSGDTIVPLRFTIEVHRTYHELGHAGMSHDTRQKLVSVESVTLKGAGIEARMFGKEFDLAQEINAVWSRFVSLPNFGASRRTQPRFLEIGPEYAGTCDTWPPTYNYYFPEVSLYTPYSYQLLTTDTTFAVFAPNAPRPVLAIDIQDPLNSIVSGPPDVYFNDAYKLNSYFYRGTPYQQAAFALQLLYSTVRQGIGYAITQCDVLGVRVNARITGQDYGLFPDQENIAENPARIVAIDGDLADFGGECQLLVPA